MDTRRMDRVFAVTQKQDGLITIGQIRDQGWSDDEIAWVTAARRLESLRPGVLADPAAPPSTNRELLAACLATPTGYASHFGAAGLYNFDGILPGAVEITCIDLPPGELRGVKVHRTKVWHPDDITTRLAIPTTSVARTLLDLAPKIDPTFFHRLVCEALQETRCSLADLKECHARIGGQQRRGNRVIREVLAAQHPETARTKSELQREYLEYFRRAGLPDPEIEYQVVIEGRVLILDLAWPPYMITAETDGFQGHGTSREKFDGDAMRNNLLNGAGWNVFHATSRLEKAAVVREIRKAMARDRNSPRYSAEHSDLVHRGLLT
jgi:very-short-patch-repair endonuclease